MTSLVVVLLLAAEDQKDDTAVTVDEVTVNAGTPKVAGAAASASTAGQHWSVVTPRTLGEGGNALEGAVGYPGAHVGYAHGMTNTLDVGGRLSVNYGYEGQVAYVQTGVKVQGLARLKFFDNGKVSLGGSFAPGLMLYFPRFLGTQVGITLPLAFNLGIVASSAMNVGIAFEMPLWIQFGNLGGFVMPVLMGAGFEYFITSSLAVWFDLRMGPSIWTNGRYPTAFTLDGKLGVGWRF